MTTISPARCDFKVVDYEEVEEISCHGGGPVGNLRISTANQTAAISRRVDIDDQVAFATDTSTLPGATSASIVTTCSPTWWSVTRGYQDTLT